MFKQKVILITGGTGSFGSTILNYFLTAKFYEVMWSCSKRTAQPGFNNKHLKEFHNDGFKCFCSEEIFLSNRKF